LSVTSTGFSPAAMHFLVHASPAALAPFRATFGVGDPAVNGGGLAHIVERQSCQGKHETDRKTNYDYFSHGRFFSLCVVGGPSRA
jgi:hypothetical protein